jgi:hypothetical protein
MAKDRVTESLLEALRQALTETGEQPMTKAGNWPGLFAGKTGVHAEAASRAKCEGFLEVVRTESKGKITIEWARITPAGVNFLHDHDSPLRALTDLQELLQTNQQALPTWLGEMQNVLHQLSTRLSQDAQNWTQQLEALSSRVTEALRRAETAGPTLTNGMTSLVPWAADVLTYLDRRQTGAKGSPCPLPELFAAIKTLHADLSLTNFHNGLRRLQDGRMVRLLPWTDSSPQLPQPEYALLDRGTLLYFVAR